MRNIIAGIAIAIVGLIGSHVTAETFFFSNATPSGLDGLAAGNVIKPEVTASFAAAPNLAIIDTDAGRLGVDSRAIPGVVDPFPNRFNLMQGALAGQGESIRFSFDRTGFLNVLYFDGMKDETLEYFRLELPNGSVRTIFDFEAEMRLNFQEFEVADLNVLGFTLADDATDDVSGLHIPFSAGGVFTLTYGQIDYATLLPGYVPKNSAGVPTGDLPNGARFEGLSVTIVPEPGTLILAALPLAMLCVRRRKASLLNSR